jgi:hypothetical protein
MMERQHVTSSMAISVGYDPFSSTLEIEFKKDREVWQYENVPEYKYEEMLSGSIGQYFQAHIKGQYAQRQVK